MSVIRTFTKRAMWECGGYSLVAGAHRWHGVAVLVYHGLRDSDHTTPGTSEELHVRRSVFESHMRVLRTVANPISLDDWHSSRTAGCSLPPRAVLVTFDDGYRSVREHAIPVLERYDVPATVFACTGPAITNRLLWHDALERRGRGAAVEAAKALPYEHWRRLISETGLAAAPHDERAVMSPDELAWCAGHPLIEIGGHTVDHPILARADVRTQRQQIAESMATLEDWTGQKVRAFAYPNGRAAIDFTSETVGIIRQLEIEWAFSTESQMARTGCSSTAVPRFTMLDAITDAQLAHYLSLTWPRAS